MTSARTMIRKSTANCTRTATTSSCESTTAESKSARDATSPLRHRALRHLNLSSRTANSTYTVASKDRNVYWWPNATFSTTATKSVYVVVTRTLPCATSWSTSTVNWAKTMSNIWILWEHISVVHSSLFCFFMSIFSIQCYLPMFIDRHFIHNVCYVSL